MKLVLLPGFDGSGQFFAPLIQRLPSWVTPQVIPYPGDTHLDYEALTQLVSGQLPDGNFILLGESFSGPVCIMLASLNPTGLQGIVLTTTFANRPLPPVIAAIARAATGLAGRLIPPATLIDQFLLNGENAPLARQVRERMRSLAPAVIAGRAREAMRVDVRETLCMLDVPALVLSSLEDRLLRKGTTQDLTRLARNCQHGALAGLHLLLQHCPNEAASRITAFIDSLAAR